MSPSADPATARLAAARDAVLSGRLEPDAAITELHAILGLNPRLAEAHLLLGIVLTNRGTQASLGEAVAELREAVSLDPAFTPARLYLGRAYLTLGRPARARDELQQGLDQVPDQPEFLVALGEAERQLGRPERAAELNRQALRIAPGLATARYGLSRALVALKRPAEAIAELEGLVASGIVTPDITLGLGTLYLGAGRIDDAVRVLEDGSGRAPGHLGLSLELGRALRAAGRLDEAEAALLRARPSGSVQASADVQRLDAQIDVELGRIRLQRDDLPAAAALLEKAVKTLPSYGLAHQQLAEVYLREGRFAPALDHARKAADLGAPLPPDRRQAIDEGLRADGGDR